MDRNDDLTAQAQDLPGSPEKATSLEPFFRLLVLEFEGGAAVWGIRLVERSPIAPQTLGEMLCELQGGTMHHVGAFANVGEAFAHALTLPLIDPCRTIKVVRPRPAPLPSFKPGQVH